MSHILIVEDSIDDLDLMRLALRRAEIGAELRSARDGVEALEQLQDAELPAVVLLDLRLPRLDGFQAVQDVVGQLGRYWTALNRRPD
ncbi:MAG TPA: response regulator [Myxococcota bacterium]|jgi:two-component system response regulator|nr:response regulator [Myxococcota bacterium]